MGGNVSKELIASYLKRVGWQKFDVLQDTPQLTEIVTGWADPKSAVHLMLIKILKEKNILMFIIPGIAKAPKDQIHVGQLADILMALGFVNYQVLIGRFCYDPSDGEIRYEFCMPIDNADISFEQFLHTVKGLVNTVDYWYSRVVDVCKGERTGQSVIDSFLKKI